MNEDGRKIWNKGKPAWYKVSAAGIQSLTEEPRMSSGFDSRTFHTKMRGDVL